MSVVDPIVIPGTTAGLTITLPVHRYGTRNAERKAYVQAGLHADEAPGLIVAHHLRSKLAEIEAHGDIVGEIVLVPTANPIGLSQSVFGRHEGRFDLCDGMNFNRGFPLLTDVAATRLSGRLGADATSNGHLLTTALRAALDDMPAVTPAEHLKRILLSLALGADTVLDLHCDGEAVMHLYTLPSQAEAFGPLARLLQARAHLVADVSGGEPFDEAISRPAVEIAQRFPDHPFPTPPIATTLELRGLTDVDQAQAAADADRIIGFLILRGHVRGASPTVPPASCDPTPLVASEALRAPVPGVLAYSVPLGAGVEAGAHVADIVDPATGLVTPIHATTSGILFARFARRTVHAGARIGKIAGREVLRSGDLLSP